MDDYRVVGTDGTVYAHRDNERSAVAVAKQINKLYDGITVEHDTGWHLIWLSPDMGKTAEEVDALETAV